MQNDFNYNVAGLKQRASGSITYGVPVAGDTIVVNGTTFTCVASSPGANEFSSASELNTLVNALASISSTLASGVISILADAPGTGGNSITLALGSNTGTMAISGATLSGGVAQTYSNTYVLRDDPEVVDVSVNVTALTGTSPTVTATVQFSLDGTNWSDEFTFAVFAATGEKKVRVEARGQFMRVKLVMGGTIPSADITILAQGREEGMSNSVPQVVNVTLGNATEETVYTIPDNTKKMMIKPRNGERLQFCFTAGGSDTTFITIPESSSGFWLDEIDLVAQSLALQAPNDNAVVVELLFFKK